MSCRSGPGVAAESWVLGCCEISLWGAMGCEGALLRLEVSDICFFLGAGFP
jgi:hypothetical protein